MKKFQTTVLTAAISLFLGSCSENQGPGHLNGATPCDSIHGLGFPGEIAEGMIPLRDAMEITQLFYGDAYKSQISIDGKLTQKEDTRSIWYNLKTLKKYIWAIEDTLCKQGCNLDSLDLGLHFYFAKYPDGKGCQRMGVDTSYAYQQTLVITATYNEKGTNVDFDPYHVGPEPCHPIPLKSYLLNVGGLEGLLRKAKDPNDPTVLNHGGLIPPPFGEGSFPSGN